MAQRQPRSSWAFRGGSLSVPCPKQLATAHAGSGVQHHSETQEAAKGVTVGGRCWGFYLGKWNVRSG